MKPEPVSFALVETALGELLVAGDGNALVYLGLAGAEGLPALREHIACHYPGRELVAKDGRLAGARIQLEEYARGERQKFELELAPAGSEFERRVWSELCAIPYGETRSYGALARALGQLGASRAVGGANGRNPIPIVIPCHRCVAADGPGGFSGGLDRKLQLLELERAHADRGQALFEFGE